MSRYRNAGLVLRAGSAALAVSVALMAAGGVAADSGGTGSIHVTQTGTLTVKASGTWSWPEMAAATKLSYTGFAIDWGDVTNGGNAVGPYHIGDGTPATNLVLQPTSPAQAPAGSWGSVSHTYAKPGTYTVCAILYDLGEVTPFKATGYHSLRAGGADRNTDNSVDQGHATPATCTTLDVAAPAETPFESFQGETATPISTATPFETLLGETSQPLATATPPVTSTGSGSSTPEQGLPLLLLALALGGLLGSVAVTRAAKARR